MMIMKHFENDKISSQTVQRWSEERELVSLSKRMLRHAAVGDMTTSSEMLIDIL